MSITLPGHELRRQIPNPVVFRLESPDVHEERGPAEEIARTRHDPGNAPNRGTARIERAKPDRGMLAVLAMVANSALDGVRHGN